MQPGHKHTQYRWYININIVFPNMSIFFFTKILTPYTISVCRNFSSPILLSDGFVVKKHHSIFVYRGRQSHWAPEKQWRYTVLTEGNSHTQKANDDCLHPAQSSNNYNHRTISQLCSIFTHWHSHNNTNRIPTFEQ